MTELAIAFTAREHAELVKVDPAQQEPSDSSVSIRTLASLVSAGTELSMQYVGEKFPAYPGYAAVGRVESVGPAVSDLKPGDLVLTMGSHRSHLVRKRQEVSKLPPGLEAPVATFARLMGVSMATLSTTRARPPCRVLVTGLGPVGHLAAQAFQASGYDVTGVDLDPRRREWASQKGISVVCEQAPTGQNFSLVLECSGHEQATLDACRAVGKGGEVVLVGVPWKKRTELSAHAVFHEVFHRYVTLRSGWEWEIPLEPKSFVGPSTYGNLDGALSWLSSGRVDVSGLFESVSPSEAQRAYQALLQQSAEKLAVVFDWTKL